MYVAEYVAYAILSICLDLCIFLYTVNEREHARSHEMREVFIFLNHEPVCKS